MESRDLRTVLLTAAVLLLFAVAWVVFVPVRGPDTTSGGGTATQYAGEFD